jgi:hypothetical protein
VKLHGAEFDADKKIQSIQENLLKKKLKEKHEETLNDDSDKNNFGPPKNCPALSKNLAHFKRPGANIIKPFAVVSYEFSL